MRDCTPEDHEALKSNPITLRSQSVFIGYQRVPSAETFIELRTCNDCGSTLTLMVESINQDWVLFTGACQLKQLAANAELVEDDEHTSPGCRADVSTARDHLRRALALLRRHLPEGLS